MTLRLTGSQSLGPIEEMLGSACRKGILVARVTGHPVSNKEPSCIEGGVPHPRAHRGEGPGPPPSHPPLGALTSHHSRVPSGARDGPHQECLAVQAPHRAPTSLVRGKGAQMLTPPWAPEAWGCLRRTGSMGSRKEGCSAPRGGSVLGLACPHHPPASCVTGPVTEPLCTSVSPSERWGKITVTCLQR